VLIQQAISDEQILKCCEVIQILRPHITTDEYLERIKKQIQTGYKLSFIEVNGNAVAAMGWREVLFLAWGKAIYVDDLTTMPDSRGKGIAGTLLDYIIHHAEENGFDQVHLDSGHGLNRWNAHRLYLNKRFNITSHHFCYMVKK